ncbi:hypothetical protein D1007_48232 [Hordeum vulgare]|nr:hypothetical protein D1007_48232 [Hordeum vulgare]
MASSSTAGASQGVARGGWKGKTSINLESAMKNMKLKDSELDEVVVGDKEISKFAEETCWLVVAKVNTRKPFNAESFKSTMKETVLDQLARRIDNVKSVEMNPTRAFEGNYVRVRVKIKVADPLVHVTPLAIRGEGTLLLPVKYEKLGYFCEVCGIMGHTLEECGNGIHGPEEVEYGQWMVAKIRPYQANQFSQNSYANPPRNRGGHRGRGGVARGNRNSNETASGARKRSSQEDGMSDDNIDDTASSPMKTDHQAQEEGTEQPAPNGTGAKKRLNLSDDINAQTEPDDSDPVGDLGSSEAAYS